MKSHEITEIGLFLVSLSVVSGSLSEFSQRVGRMKAVRQTRFCGVPDGLKLRVQRKLADRDLRAPSELEDLVEPIGQLLREISQRIHPAYRGCNVPLLVDDDDRR